MSRPTPKATIVELRHQLAIERSRQEFYEKRNKELAEEVTLLSQRIESEWNDFIKLLLMNTDTSRLHDGIAAFLSRRLARAAKHR